MSNKIKVCPLCGSGFSQVRPENETYLGDGLYASFDGMHVVLRAPRDGGDHFVYIEPSVWGALLEFVVRLKEESASKQ